MEENSPEIKQFIRERSSMFWYIREDAKENISLDVLVEFILNYGDANDVRELFKLLGVKKVAEIFYKNTSGLRCNYFPRTKHFFNLYFQRNAR